MSEDVDNETGRGVAMDDLAKTQSRWESAYSLPNAVGVGWAYLRIPAPACRRGLASPVNEAVLGIGAMRSHQVGSSVDALQSTDPTFRAMFWRRLLGLALDARSKAKRNGAKLEGFLLTDALYPNRNW